jgi:hypothetical protein
MLSLNSILAIGNLHILYMDLCNCVQTEEMALKLYIHSHNHVTLQCLRSLFSTVIGIDFTVNHNQGVCNANHYTHC